MGFLNLHRLRNDPKAKLVLAALVCALALGYFFYQGSLRKEYYAKRSVEAEIIHLSGLPAGVTINATLSNREGVYPLTYKEGALFLPPEAIALFSVPYEITAQIHKGDDLLYTIDWSLDREGVFYRVSAKGLEETSLSGFSIDGKGKEPYAAPDWAGKVGFQFLLDPRENSEICLKIKDKGDVHVCQKVIGKSKGGDKDSK